MLRISKFNFHLASMSMALRAPFFFFLENATHTDNRYLDQSRSSTQLSRHDSQSLLQDASERLYLWRTRTARDEKCRFSITPTKSTYENLSATFLLFFNHANVVSGLAGSSSPGRNAPLLASSKNNSRNAVYNTRNQRHKFSFNVRRGFEGFFLLAQLDVLAAK